MNFQELKQNLPGLEENVLLKNHTSFKIGGPAKFFYSAKTRQDLIKSLEVSKKFGLPVFILGGGSNILVSEKGFDGLVIKTENFGIQINENIISVESGVCLKELIIFSLDKGLTGLEWGIGIPGTVGGAIRGNAGAFGDEMASCVKSVEVLDLNTMKIKEISKKDCEFDYRESIFKKNPLVIISAEIELEKGDKEESKILLKQHLLVRKNSYTVFPSAGCVFKNLKNIDQNQKLFQKFPELEQFSKKGNISAGTLIDQCGLKGKQIGGGLIFQNHANFIVNFDNASATDIYSLINLAQDSVKEKYRIELELEIQLIGF